MIQSIFNTSLQSIQSDMMNMLESLVPVVIAIVGAYLVVTFGITWLKNALGLNGFESDGMHFQNQAEYEDYQNGIFDGEPEDYMDHDEYGPDDYSLVGTPYDYGYDLMDGDFDVDEPIFGEEFDEVFEGYYQEEEDFS